MKRNEFKSRSIGRHLPTDGSELIVYTCPPNFTAHVSLLFVSNMTAGNKTVTVKWFNSHDNTEYYIIAGYVVSAYNFMKMDGSYLTLNAGDHMCVACEAGSTMDVTLTVEEFYDPTSKQ